MNRTLELAANRRITKAFIETAPIEVALVPRVKIPQPSGGSKWGRAAPRDVQRLRLVEPSSARSTAPVRAIDGIDRVIEFMLIGEHDAEIGLYDVFTHDGAEWEVLYAHPFNGWERRVEVARRG